MRDKTQPITLYDIQTARERIAPYIRNTDITSVLMPNRHALFVKTENLQVTGSFKVRGAANRILQLSHEDKQKGVIAASAGNHAQGVARAAQNAGIDCTIVMPRTAPLAKIAATEQYGAKVVLYGNNYDDACDHAYQLQREQGAAFIHPFDDPDVIAGQGTIALEILAQCPEIQQILVPVGGGGLIAGIAVAVKALRPDVMVIGVEPKNAASMRASLLNGRVATLDSAATMADGIAVKTPGVMTYALCEEYVDEIVEVEEDDIASTILFLMEKAKIIAEGAGAAAITAAYSGKVSLAPPTVAVLSGGNIDVTMISRIIERGLVRSGRKVTLRLSLNDRPGELARLSALIAQAGANVVAVHHDRMNLKAAISDIVIDIELETRDQQQAADIVVLLKREGYRFLA